MALKDSKSLRFSKTMKEISKDKIKRDYVRTRGVVVRHLLLICSLALMFSVVIFFVTAGIFGIPVSRVFNPLYFTILVVAFILCGAYTFKPYGMAKYFETKGDNAVAQIPKDILESMLANDKYKPFITELMGVKYEGKDNGELFDHCKFYDSVRDFEKAINKLIEYIYGDKNGIDLEIKDKTSSVVLSISKDKSRDVENFTRRDFFFSRFINHYFRYLPNDKLAFLDVDYFIDNTEKVEYDDIPISKMSMDEIFGDYVRR